MMVLALPLNQTMLFKNRGKNTMYLQKSTDQIDPIWAEHSLNKNNLDPGKFPPHVCLNRLSSSLGCEKSTGLISF